MLDADEWVSEGLAARVQEIVRGHGGPEGYSIRRRNYFVGKLIEYSGWQRDYNLRLFRTKKGRYAHKRVLSFVQVDGPPATLDEPMFHETYRVFEEYFRTFARFTTWSAQDIPEKSRRVGLVDLTLRPAFRFFKMYVLQQGFRGGYHGAVLCGLAAFSVVTKYAKAWNLGRIANEPKPNA